MNKTFKRVWSRSRGALVAVSEIASSISHNKAKVTALVLGSALSMNAVAGGKLNITSGDYTAGALDGYDEIIFGPNVGKVSIGSINSPTAYFHASIKRNADNVYISGPKVTVNGNTTLKKGYLSSATITINGNLNTIGKVTDADWAKLSNGGSLDGNYSGVSSFHSVAELGGSLVKGDVTTSALINQGGSVPTKFSEDDTLPWAKLTIEGNLTTDYVVSDSAMRYGKGNDYLCVKGTTKVSKELINNGFAQLNKTIISGKFINGIGEYVGLKDVLEYEGKLGAEIAELDVPYIENGSLLNVGKFTRTQNVQLNVTYGTVKSTENWLDHSNINISGGLMDALFFGAEQSLGNANVYKVTGGTLAANQLGSGSTVTVSDAGVFKTSTETAFEGFNPVQVGLNVIGFGSDSTQEISEVLTDSFTEYKAGNLKDAFSNVVTFTNGKLLISGANLTQTQASDLEKSFKSKIYSPLTKTLLSALSHEWSEIRIFLSQGGFNEQNFQENMESISGLFRCSQ